MIRKIEHLGIAVNNLEDANELFKKLLGENHYKVEEVQSEGVSTSFFMLGETKIELLEATSEEALFQEQDPRRLANPNGYYRVKLVED